MILTVDTSSKAAQLKNTASSDFILEADLHCHLLPDWDDGPRTLQNSLDMASRASQCGVKRIVVTPHVGRAFRTSERPASDIPAATAALQREIHAAGIDLELIPGAEIMLSVADLPTRVKAEEWLTVGSGKRYLLVEAPTNVWSDTADNLLFQLALGGLIPIIAHPERLNDVQKDIGIMKRAVDRGAVLQITARSLVGPNRPARECSRRLLSAGLVSLVASDAHKAEHLWPPEIAPALLEIAGEAATAQILKENPLAVLAGEPIKRAEVKPPAPKKFWFW